MQSLLKKVRKLFSNDSAILQKELAVWKQGFVPPGHYYSPVNNMQWLKEHPELFSYNNEVKDIDLVPEKQQQLLEELVKLYNPSFFPDQPAKGFRYYYNNNFFSYSDATFLFCLMQYLKPRRIIEVGSGFSSAVMIDTREKMLGGDLQLTFVEPYPERLLSLLKPKDLEEIRLIKSMIQETELGLFRELQANDILFVDSSHVSKFGSDLNHILFNILPEINEGVYIHFHDIFYPFEYPKEWVLQGRGWNEIYLLRAFLMNNKDYEIALFPPYLEKVAYNWLETNMPLTLKLHEKWPSEENFAHFLENRGQSLWLKKVKKSAK